MLSRQSQDKLNTCHPDLIRIIEKAQRILESKNEHITLTVLEGTRDEKTQNEYFDKGVSKLRYPQSKHNQNPSLAVDVKPDKVGWGCKTDTNKLYESISDIVTENIDNPSIVLNGIKVLINDHIKDINKDLKDKAAFYRLAGMIVAIAFYEGVGIRWGGDWDMDNDLTDQTFDDLPHFELFT